MCHVADHTQHNMVVRITGVGQEEQKDEYHLRHPQKVKVEAYHPDAVQDEALLEAFSLLSSCTRDKIAYAKTDLLTRDFHRSCLKQISQQCFI